MNKIILIILLFAGIASAAEPTISSWSGTANEGQTITISGGNFGTKDVTKQVYLDPDAIASSDEDIVDSEWPSRWSRVSTSLPPVYFDTADKHSGSYSIRADRTVASYPTGFGYHFPEAETKVFVSVWSKIVTTQAGQWKHVRLETAGDVSDPHTGVYSEYGSFLRNGYPRGPSNHYKGMQCDSAGDGDCYPSNEYRYRYTDDGGGTTYSPTANRFKLSADQWINTEIEFQHNSVAGAEDGRIQMIEYSSSQGRKESYPVDNSTWETRDENSTSTGINYAWLQNYLGNGITVGSVYHDNIYFAWGDGYRARPYICDAAHWADVAHCELQVPTSWATGAVAVTLGRGSFAAGTSQYLYVMNPTGEVNATGVSITLGGTGGEPPPADITPPVFSNPVPGIDAVGVAKNTAITGTISDGYSNVDQSETKIYLDTVDITASCTIGADAVTVNYSCTHAVDFESGSLQTVRVTTQDTATIPNPLDTSYSFTAEVFGPQNRASIVEMR